jgi:hypothetical protein
MIARNEKLVEGEKTTKAEEGKCEAGEAAGRKMKTNKRRQMSKQINGKSTAVKIFENNSETSKFDSGGH